MTSKLHPYIPFDDGVPPVPDEDQGVYCWSFDRKWKPYLLGLMKTLLISRTYDSDNERCVNEAKNLLASLIGDSNCSPETGTGCVDFPTSAPLITWEPQDPINEPEYIPPGYIAVPFIYVTSDLLISFFPGVEVGDVISGYLSLPVLTPALGEGLARFRVNVFGEGTVEIHLIQIPAGGSALIVTDDNLLTAVSVELNKDLVSLPPETVSVIIQEVELTGIAAHHIDVTFLPRFNDEAIFVAYGGGLRKIVLCGFDDMGEFMDVRQNEENPCQLEKSIDGLTWSQFANLQLCIPNLRVVGNELQYSTDGGVTFFKFPEAGEPNFGDSTPLWPPESVPEGESGACLAAENIVAMLQQEVFEWHRNLEAGALGLALASVIAGILAFFIVPVATVAILGFATTIVGIGASGLDTLFTTEVYDRLKCILFCHAGEDGAFTVDEYSEIIDDVNAESGTAWDLIEQWLDFRGAVGLTRMANAAGITDGDCDCPDCAWCVEFDFETGQHGWYDESPYGTYVAGNGFETTCYNNGGTAFEAWAIMFDLPSGCVITRSEFIYDANIVAGNSANFRYDVSGGRTYHFFTPETGTDVEAAENNTVSDALTQIGFSIVAQQSGSYPACTGWATLKKAILRGTGTIPSGGVEC